MRRTEWQINPELRETDLKLIEAISKQEEWKLPVPNAINLIVKEERRLPKVRSKILITAREVYKGIHDRRAIDAQKPGFRPLPPEEGKRIDPKKFRPPLKEYANKYSSEIEGLFGNDAHHVMGIALKKYINLLLELDILKFDRSLFTHVTIHPDFAKAMKGEFVGLAGSDAFKAYLQKKMAELSSKA